MFKLSPNKQMKSPMPQALALSLFGVVSLYLPAHSQSGSVPGASFGNSAYGSGGTSTLRNPLVPGASFSMPGSRPSLGAPPPPGHGMVPVPPNPGMLTPPTLIPWADGTAGNSFSKPTSQVINPSNQIDLPNNKISLPVSNSSAMPPGAMNAQIKGSIPHGPSTPGADPGMLRPASFNNGSSAASSGQSQQSAAAIGSVDSNGQINGSAPTKRAVRQSSNDFGLKRNFSGYRAQFSGGNGSSTFQQWVPNPSSSTTDFGQSVKEVGVKPAQISFDSPRPTRAGGGSGSTHAKNFAGAQVTNDLFGLPMVNPKKMSTDTSGNVKRGPEQTLMTIADK
jgi:hypothetical protein